MAKAPATMFYVRDWLTDEHLVKVSFQTKGMWIDLIAHLWLSETRGKTTATRRELCSILGATMKELSRFFDENDRHPFCDVSCENGVYTIENRRMVREEAQRAGTRERVSRHRDAKRNAQCNENVTPPLAVAVALAVTEQRDSCSTSPEAERLATLLLDAILAWKPDYHKPSTVAFRKWAVDIDRMLRIDKRTPDEVEAVIAWATQDDFWQSNILSAGKLRKQFDQLQGQIRRGGVKAIGGPVSETVEEQAARILGESCG